MKCPKCESTNIFELTVREAESFLQIILLTDYQCNECGYIWSESGMNLE